MVSSLLIQRNTCSEVLVGRFSKKYGPSL
jgi:hypothetical protein